MEELARVYSRSLFEVARKLGKLDVVREQLATFADAVHGSHDLQVFLFSPYFSTQEKRAGLGRALGGADEVLENFLTVLIDNHRMPVIFRIRSEYERLWEQENRFLGVEITSAVELDPKTTAELGEQIGRHTGKRIELRSRVDPDILGGIVLRVGNAVIDASIRHRLERLRTQLAGATAA